MPYSLKIHLLAVCFITAFSLFNLRAASSRINVEVKDYSVADGLSHQHVYQTFQDSRGIIWFVTANGLNAFDGTHFYLALEWPLLKSPHELSIRLESHGGRLWVMSPGGEQPSHIVDVHTRKAIPFSTYMDTTVVGMPTDVAIDQNQRLVILNTKGECWIQLAGRQWKKIQTGLQGLQFVQPHLEAHLIWVGDRMSGIKAIQFRAFTDTGKPVLRKMISGVRSYQKWDGNAIWIWGNDRMGFIYPDGTEKWTPLAKDIVFSAQVGFLYNGLEADEQRVWILEEGGVLVWNFRTNERSRITSIEAGKKLNPGLHHLFRDRQKNYWISGIQGVCRLRKLEDRFTRINWLDPSLTANYFQNSARGIVEGKDRYIYVVWPQFATLES